MDDRTTDKDLHIPSLRIEGFRGVSRLEVSQLGRVTLITGKNNTGKSSILEALRLHTQNADPRVVGSILTSREEHDRRRNQEEQFSDPDGVVPVSALFYGFPRLSDHFSPITIEANGRAGLMKLTLRVDWVAEELDSRRGQASATEQDAQFEETELQPTLIAETEEEKYAWSLERYVRQFDRHFPRPSSRERMPCIFVSSSGAERTGNLGKLWDDIALTDSQQDVVDALHIIEPGISDITLVGGEGTFRTRTMIARTDNFPRPVPLRSFGDGLNRLLAIVLSLVNAGGGLLLIDEFENGLHHTVQLDTWRVIFRMAQSLDVQVFATSHSWDAVEAFQEAASEAPEDGALLRLTRRGDDIIPTVFSEEELAVVTRDQIEVR